MKSGLPISAVLKTKLITQNYLNYLHYPTCVLSHFSCKTILTLLLCKFVPHPCLNLSVTNISHMKSLRFPYEFRLIPCKFKTCLLYLEYLNMFKCMHNISIVIKMYLPQLNHPGEMALWYNWVWNCHFLSNLSTQCYSAIKYLKKINFMWNEKVWAIAIHLCIIWFHVIHWV